MTKDYLVTPTKVGGTVTVPPSKSQTLRAILFASLAQGKSIITRPLKSPDTTAMIQACQQMGADIHFIGENLEIIGTDPFFAPCTIDAGNSGIVSRFFTAVASLGASEITITGDHSLQNLRRIDPLTRALRELGATVSSGPFLPVKVKGPWKNNECSVLGEDSQFVSALLISAGFAPFPISIKVINPGEKPWVQLTLHWLDFLKIPYERKGFYHFSLLGNGRIQPFHYKVPSDLSSLAFPIASAMITSSQLDYQNVDFQDPQGDKKLFDFFREMGASISNNTVIGKPLLAIDADVNDCIDAVPILAAVACFAKGTTVIKNAKVARGKECDRLSCTAKELRKMGAKIEEREDGLIIEGGSLTGAEVYSHNDHRLAMALAIAGLGAEGPTRVRAIDCVEKTFPHFAKTLPGIQEVM
ncbi:MAG: 3-phosphoshikimate 1-carboxyvinyltransferase [Waddliaceae bacterium]